MGRVKTRMEFITSEKKRKLVYAQRSKCIKQKARELSTLCGIDVALFVIDLTTSSDTNIETHAWPNNGNKADEQKLLHDLITRYKTHGSVKRKTKKTINVERLLGSRYIQGMSQQELRKLATFLDSQIEKAKERIQYLKKGKQLMFNDDENKGSSVFSVNQPQLADIGADLNYLLDSKDEGISEQELRKLATVLDGKVGKGKQVIVSDDENEGCDELATVLDGKAEMVKERVEYLKNRKEYTFYEWL